MQNVTWGPFCFQSVTWDLGVRRKTFKNPVTHDDEEDEEWTCPSQGPRQSGAVEQ